MIEFTATIKKFGDKGEKTGWSYIEISPEQAEELKPDTKVSFLVKGWLDEVAVKSISLLPMGGGRFILALKGDLRKTLRKNAGAMLRVRLERDDQLYQINETLLECLHDLPEALLYFESLPHSHQKYFSKWIESAKTETTRASRIAQCVEAMQYRLTYPEMIRRNKKNG